MENKVHTKIKTAEAYFFIIYFEFLWSFLFSINILIHNQTKIFFCQFNFQK